MPSWMRMTPQARCALLLGLGQLAVFACGSDPAPAREPAARATGELAAADPGAAQSVPAGDLPRGVPPPVRFVAPEPWRSTREGAAPVEPPQPPTWRALVSQNEPLQVKTPLWQPLPPAETIELAMPPASRFRCVVTPLQMTAQANDFGTKLKAWLLVRTLRCSSDDFLRWTEDVYAVRILPDGTLDGPAEAGALLRERDEPAGQVRESFVMLRSDEERRTATTGPPRIVAGVPVDDD